MSPASRKTQIAKPGTILQVPRNIRIPFVRRCTLVRAQAEQEGMILDLSLSGAYVRTDTMPHEGESLDVCFRVPGNDRLLRFSSVVAWLNLYQAHPVHSMPPGLGLRFLDPSPDDLKLVASTIHNYLRSNPLYRKYL